MTMTVSRVVSFLDGQVTFFNSSIMSLVKAGEGSAFLSMDNSIQDEIISIKRKWIPILDTQYWILYTSFMLKNIVFFFILASYYLLLATISFAANLQSPRYQIDVESLGINVQEIPAFYTLSSRFGANWDDLFTTQGYILDIDQNSIGSDLSENNINLGELKSGTFLQATTSLTVKKSPEKGSRASFIQLYPMKNTNGDIIEPTSLPKVWTSQSAFGFGYRESGPFSHFRPLPNENRGDFPNFLFSSLKQDDGEQAKITFRLNPRPGLAGSFETVLNFIVLPNY